MKVVPVILAGGKGTRLWPLSRSSAPKQFMKFLNETTLFQEALLRCSDKNNFEPPIIITNEDFRFLAAEQSRQVNIAPAAIILEPEGRNTAASIVVAAGFAKSLYEDEVVLHIFASDHELDVNEQFIESFKIGRDAASKGSIVTFGIEPSEPATGYGYICKGDHLQAGLHKVDRFVEKPDRENAARMLAEGGFLWNSGIFMVRADVILSEASRYSPQVFASALAGLEAASKDLDFVRLDRDGFGGSPNISIDFAVLEKSENVVVVPSSFSWSDLGTWDAIWKTGKKDGEGNVKFGNAITDKTSNSLVVSRSSHLAVHGLDGVAVIASEDAVYVGPLEASQNVGDIVKYLASHKETKDLAELHPTSLRPWGGYTSVLKGERFQVKRIFVEPGKTLSLQMHHHRAEHWICVRGTAEVTIGDKVSTVCENESVYIPLGEIHRLSNPGRIMLEMIEVQTGSYLGEDDIVRFDDVYGRA